MVRIGYALSSEEHGPAELVRQARLAEEAGFQALWISDHFHPWNDEQGQSPFVWSTIGALSQVTRLPVSTAVTCPTTRMHPAIVAQAAATSAALLPGRFVLGVGSGEALNEHVLGDRWPPAAVRLAMLEEAVEVMRKLWRGGTVDHRGPHYTVENARLYTLPDAPPPVYVSGFGPASAKLAGRIGDGFCSTIPDAELLRAFREAGGDGKPAQAGTKACWAVDEASARKTAHRLWANMGLPGELAQMLPTPRHFEQASSLVTEDAIAQSVPCGNDPRRHVAAIGKYVDAGYDEVYVQQIGPEQDGFFAFYADRVLPEFG
jgi:G6PDH family F420-dependent oxidoreductase